MNFLNPAVLFGLIAAAIPLILHLINLRKLKNIEFSSLKFIKELQKTKIKKLKIKQWLLLLIRTLIVICIVLAFARPIADTKLPYFASYSKSSAILLIDNSFSMDVSDEFGNRLKQAKNIAKEITNMMNEGDELAVIPMASKDFNNIALSRNYNLITEQIDKIRISNLKSELRPSLLTAYNLLEDAVNLNKEIFIISDGAENIFPSAKDSLKIMNSAGVNFIQIGKESNADIKNYSIDSLNINNQIFQYGSNVNLDALISNHSSNNIDDLVLSLIFNDKRIAQRTVDVASLNQSGISLETEINQRGAIDAFLELENDELLQDNKRYFSFLIPEKPLIAILSDENERYLNLALKASNSEIDIRTYTNKNIGTANLNNFDLIIIADKPTNQSDYARLKNYVEGGGSLVAFADEDMNKQYVDFLTDIGFGSFKEYEYNTGNPGEIDYTDLQHPVFNDLFLNADENKKPESPEIFTLKSFSGGRILLKSGEAAVLSESSTGDGKVLYFALSPDTRMSDMPLTALFPALMYKSAMYLTSQDIKGNVFTTGENINIIIESKYAGDNNFEIIDPNGNSFFERGANLPSGTLLSFDDINIPGNYLIKNNEKVISIFSVNNDLSESNTNIPDANEIQRKFKQFFTEDANVNFISSTEKIDEMIIRARIGTELWQIFIIFAILLALAELIIQKTQKSQLSND